jgi:hypothetical protein
LGFLVAFFSATGATAGTSIATDTTGADVEADTVLEVRTILYTLLAFRF